MAVTGGIVLFRLKQYPKEGVQGITHPLLPLTVPPPRPRPIELISETFHVGHLQCFEPAVHSAWGGLPFALCSVTPFSSFRFLCKRPTPIAHLS